MAQCAYRFCWTTAAPSFTACNHFLNLQVWFRNGLLPLVFMLSGSHQTLKGAEHRPLWDPRCFLCVFLLKSDPKTEIRTINDPPSTAAIISSHI